jgi:predicted DNA-binding transcriptional regulator AlpA
VTAPGLAELQALEATLSGRIERTHEALLAGAKAGGYYVTADGRVPEACLAHLLGLAPGTLRNRRREGRAPPHYRVGGAGHAVTYRLAEVAQWIEAGREY